MDILVVDDDQAVLESFGDFLGRRNHRVRKAGNGLEARRLIEAQRPDLVISDIQMPGLDGIGLLQVVHQGFPDLPVILITGYESVETAVAALRGRAYDYLKKPVELEELLDCIKEIQTVCRPTAPGLRGAKKVL